jgi:hypothetical protein
MTEPPGQEDGDMGLTSKVRRLSDISTRENMACASCPQTPSVSVQLSSLHASSS